MRSATKAIAEDNIVNALSFKGLEIDNVIDAKGKPCPLPLLKAKMAINEVSGGQLVKVLCTDRGSLRDFTIFAEMSGHTLLLSGEFDRVFVHILQKKIQD